MQALSFIGGIRNYTANFPPNLPTSAEENLILSFSFSKCAILDALQSHFPQASLIKSIQMFPSGSAKCQISHFFLWSQRSSETKREFYEHYTVSLQGISELICFITWIGCIEPLLNLITLLNNGATTAFIANTAGAIKRWISHIPSWGARGISCQTLSLISLAKF